VACAPDGYFCAVWEDGRGPIGTEIYAQRFTRDGARKGGNFRVNDDPLGNDHFSPSCAFDTLGRLAVVWQDYRAPRPNPEIYAQRYNADGSLMSDNQLLNEPDLFYYNHHWTMNKSVAAIGNRLAFTWTENRRHRGWDTYNKITDWNLVDVAEPASANRPLDLSLSVWPNPQSPARSNQPAIHLVLPVRQHVRLALFDATGREVRQLYDGVPATTELSLRLNQRGLSLGPYFVVARTATRNVTAKLVVAEGR